MRLMEWDSEKNKRKYLKKKKKKQVEKKTHPK